MKSQPIDRLLEESQTPNRDVKLNKVFNKISGIYRQQELIPDKELKFPHHVLPVQEVKKCGVLVDGGEDGEAHESLARLLEQELRAAKTAQLACGEVLLPEDLLPRIASDILGMAENEPCGLRGCTLFINFESDVECRRLATVKCDPNTVSTFELFLTFKQDARHSWHSLLPQFLKNFTKGGTIMISHNFALEKKKLYRSYLE